MGDFAGLTQKLDYIAGLGVTAIWLLPFYPSPLRDDGYDIADYTRVHPDYGTLRDFRGFVRAAHRRGLRVITELVVNHTSRPASVVRRVALVAQEPAARLVRVERHRPALRRRADHLHRYRDLELDVGPGVAAVLLASVLQPPARPELRQPAGHPRDPAGDALLARPRRRRAAAGRGAVPRRARRHERREPARDPRRAAPAARGRRRALPEPDAAGRGEPVAARRAALLRRRPTRRSATWPSTSR